MAPTPQQSQLINTKKLTGKQPSARVQRYLKKQGPQLNEPARSILLLKGIRCPEAMTTILRDLRSIKAPHSKLLLKNNAITALFENSHADGDAGIQSLEFLTTKNDCSLFALANHNKKRPNNLIYGRTFDHKILDMVELGVLYYKSIADYKSAPKKRTGSKPLLFFDGDLWEHNRDLNKLRNLLIDVYRGDPVKQLIVSGVDHMISFTVTEQPIMDENGTLIGGAGAATGAGVIPVIHMRTYFVKLKKHPDGKTNTPLPFLIPCGPDMDFKVRKSRFATPDIWKLAMKQPKQNKSKKVKNHKTNIFGETIGRLHLEKQDIDNLGGKKSKALRLAEKAEKAEEREKLEQELESEKKQMEGEFKQTYGFEEKEMEQS